MIIQNRTAFTGDQRQGDVKRVLCVCYGNQLRSPTAALVLSGEPFNFNTRSCGVDPNSAVCLIDNVMVEWANEIVVMEDLHKSIIQQLFPGLLKPIIVLGLSDNYTYRDPILMSLVAERYQAVVRAG